MVTAPSLPGSAWETVTNKPRQMRISAKPRPTPETTVLEKFFKKSVEMACSDKSVCNNCCKGCVRADGGFQYFTEQVEYLKEPLGSHITRAEKLKQIPEAMDLLNALKTKYGWDNQKGFMSTSGCKVPRAERSLYCQQTGCRNMHEILKSSNWEELHSKFKRLQEIRIENKLLV